MLNLNLSDIYSQRSEDRYYPSYYFDQLQADRRHNRSNIDPYATLTPSERLRGRLPSEEQWYDSFGDRGQQKFDTEPSYSRVDTRHRQQSPNHPSSPTAMTSPYASPPQPHSQPHEQRVSHMIHRSWHNNSWLGRIAQSVMCLATDASLTADLGVASSILTLSHTFVEIVYGHSPPFRWIIQEGLLSVTSKSMCTKYWLTACSSLPRKKSVVSWTDHPTMTIAVDLGRKVTKQTNDTTWSYRPTLSTF